MNREEMVEELKENLMQITFTKLDGTTRVMKCTLHKSFTEFVNEATKAKLPTNEEVIPVWDIDNNSWRSFRVASVTDVKKIGKIPDDITKPNLPKPPGGFIAE